MIKIVDLTHEQLGIFPRKLVGGISPSSEIQMRHMTTSFWSWERELSNGMKTNIKLQLCEKMCSKEWSSVYGTIHRPPTGTSVLHRHAWALLWHFGGHPRGSLGAPRHDWHLGFGLGSWISQNGLKRAPLSYLIYNVQKHTLHTISTQFNDYIMQAMTRWRQ